LLHLLLFLPGGGGVALEDEVLVVVGGFRVLDPEVARADLAVEEARVFADRGVVAPGAAEVEDAGGGAAVAFRFDLGAGGHRVDAEAPDQAVFAEASLPGTGDPDPFATAF